MLSINLLQTPGEHPLTLSGKAGAIEAVLTVPENAHHAKFALLGHPHSLQGGSMNNKVVTTLARTFRELNIPSLRFNFRGVGESAGQYDAGIGESEDMKALAELWQEQNPSASFLLAGFSFGSFVAYRTALTLEHELLITIAPPVHHYDYSPKVLGAKPWVIVQGDEDDVVPYDVVSDFIASREEPISLLSFHQTGHFFHGKLVELKQRLIEVIQKQVTAL